MAWSDRVRHRDRDPGRRQLDDLSPPPGSRLFTMTDGERQEIAKSLRRIDEARRVLEAQHDRENREIIRELKASADRIFDVLNGLDEIEQPPSPGR